MTYFPSLSNPRESTLGDQKLGSSCQEQLLCSANLMMFMNHQDPSCGDYSEIFSGVSSNYVESVGDRSNGEMGFIPPVVGILDHSNFQCQGVSLSLSTHLPSVVSLPSFPSQYQTRALPSSFICAPPSIFEQRSNPKLCMSDAKNGMYMSVAAANLVSNSIYVEAAQQLLDEVVSIGEALKELKSKKLKGSNDLTGEMCSDATDLLLANSSGDLSPTERQDLKNKNSKLLSLLGEVSQPVLDVLASVFVFHFCCMSFHDDLSCCCYKNLLTFVEVAIVVSLAVKDCFCIHVWLVCFPTGSIKRFAGRSKIQAILPTRAVLSVVVRPGSGPWGCRVLHCTCTLDYFVSLSTSARCHQCTD